MVLYKYLEIDKVTITPYNANIPWEGILAFFMSLILNDWLYRSFIE